MLLLRSYWLALLLLPQEVCCPRRLVDSTSLVDWRCSYLCSELILSVTEKSVIFIKKLSFPQTVPTDEAFFQPELGWSAFGLLGRSWADTGLVCRSCVIGPRVGLLLLLIGTHHFFGLGEWAGNPVFVTLSSLYDYQMYRL